MSEPRLPGLPAGAVPIDVSSLEIEMNRSRLLPATLPVTVYDAMLCVNGLIMVEAMMTKDAQHKLAGECRQLQQFLRKHIAFHPKVNAQFELNRKFWELPPLAE